MSSTRRDGIVVSTLLVAVLSFTSALLLLSAFVIWFAEIINSITLSLTITGLALAVAAWVTYKIKLAPILRLLLEEYQRVVTVISLIKCGYDSLVQRFLCLLTFLK